MVEWEESDTAVAIGAGVAHSFGLNTCTGAIVAGPDGDVNVRAVKTTYLDWIGVLPAHRGKKLGEFITVSCLRSLTDRGERVSTRRIPYHSVVLGRCF